MTTLPTRKLGKNGPEVTALGLGLMGLGSFYGAPKPDAERLALLDKAYELGARNWDSGMWHTFYIALFPDRAPISCSLM